MALGLSIVFKRALSPAGHCWGVLVLWVFLWIIILVGSAIMMAIENPTREEAEKLYPSLAQPPMNFLDALYFTSVYLTSCGTGDIVALTPGGRAFLCIWSFIGTTVWLILASSIVLFVCDWIYVNVVLNFVWYYTAERYVRQALQTMGSTHDLEQAASKDKEREPSELQLELSQAEDERTRKENDEPSRKDGDQEEIGPNPRLRSRSQLGDTWEEVKAHSLNDDVLSWKGLIILNLIALFVYYSVHLFYTGVLRAIDPDLANLGPVLTPSNFGTSFYASYVFSQTICFGTDYSPKTSDSRAFFVAWQQFNLIAATFLFTTVMLALVRSTRTTLFNIIERILKKNYREPRKRILASIRRKHMPNAFSKEEIERIERIEETEKQLEEEEMQVHVPQDNDEEKSTDL